MDFRKNTTERAPAKSWLGLVATLGPVLVVAMDGSILFLAIPSINEAIRPSTDQALWILDIYGFIVGSLLITFGNLGDRFGRKKLLLIGAAVFGIGSACTAFSPSPGVLIASRALMGLGGATLLPSCLAVISELFANPSQRARAIAVFAATFAAGFVIGPTMGGFLLARFWWGSVFLINIPVIVLFLCLAPLLLREVRGARPGRTDLFSILLSAMGLLLAIHGIKRITTYGAELHSGLLTILGFVLLAVFILRQRSLKHPLLDVSLFKEPVFSVAILTGFFSLFVWSSAAYLSMTYLQSFLGLPVLDSALLAIPGAMVLILFSVFTPLLVEHVGARTALIICHFSMALGMLMLVFTGSSTGTVFYIASTLVSGIGFGISFSLVADTAVGAVPESRAGAAGAVAETSNEIGNALGIALLGSVLTVVFRIIYPGTETGLGEVIDSSGIDSEAFIQAQKAFLAGFHIVATVAAAICGILGFLTIRWIPAPRAPRNHRS